MNGRIIPGERPAATRAISSGIREPELADEASDTVVGETRISW